MSQSSKITLLFVAPKTGYSQGATPYAQTQQTQRQVTAIKPATPSPATSTFSIYPVSSAVQPSAAAASVVPSYSQSPTYSTNAVTYSGKNIIVLWLKWKNHDKFIFHTFYHYDAISNHGEYYCALCLIMAPLCMQEHHTLDMKLLCIRPRPPTTTNSSSSNSSRNRRRLLQQPLPRGPAALLPRKPPSRIKLSNLNSPLNHLRYTTVMSARSAVPDPRYHSLHTAAPFALSQFVVC